MDISAANKSSAGANKSANTSGRRGAPRSNGPSRTSSRIQQNVVRHLGADIPRGPNTDRVSGNSATLKVLGLKNSRAASNADGGIRSLLDFLEKKATNVKTSGSDRGRRVRPVIIKKVCAGVQSMGNGKFSGIAPGPHSAFCRGSRRKSRRSSSPIIAPASPVIHLIAQGSLDLANLP